MSFCRTCTSRLAQHALKGVARPTATSSRYIASTSIRSENNDALDRAKARAWYLDPKPTPAETAGPSKPTRREPRFTTFDPESTRSDLVTEDIIPLHENATSPLLAQLHDHLTRQSDSVDHASVRFLHTPSSGLLRTQTQEQEGLGVDGALLGESGNTNWEWVVTCQVRGRGRGVLNRAEKEIRKWMRETLGKRTRTRSVSREEGDTDWSMVHVGQGVCVNLFTAEGKERWNLEELWAQTGEATPQ